MATDESIIDIPSDDPTPMSIADGNRNFLVSLRQRCSDDASCMNAVYNNTCQSTDNVNKLERGLFIYLYPFIATLCVVGNTANLIVYNHAYLRSSTTIRMLAIKAMANILNILSLLPMHISSLALLSPSSHEIPPPLYWLSLRYVLFFSNVFSTIAIWLTAAVSIENCLLVVFPVHAKLWCTMRNAWTSMAMAAVAALFLHAFNLFCREVFPIWCYDTIGKNISETYGFQIMDTYVHFESVYYWFNGISTIVLPMVIMLTATLLINYHLVWAARSELISRGSEQKRCVVRLSFVTILCHVVFEMPHLAVLAIAARSGSAQEMGDEYTASSSSPSSTTAAGLIQILSTASNFLAQINASIPFVVYFLCSKRFRQLCMITIGGRSALDSFSTTGGAATAAGASSTRASASYRRSEVVLLNNSRLSVVGHLPLSTFNRGGGVEEKTSPGDTTTTTATNTSLVASPPLLLNHHSSSSSSQQQQQLQGEEDDQPDNEANHQHPQPHHRRASAQLITCSESTNLLHERND